MADPITRVAGDAPMALWLVDLRVPPDPRLVACLSPVETTRAARFLRAIDRDRYIATHAALRLVVERHGGIPAATQAYHRAPAGRWHLASAPDWHPSVSYAGDTALIGLARHHAIGVDLEAHRPIKDAAALAAPYFNRDELAGLAGLAPADRDAGFLRCWTRKEACAKAIGAGLSLPVIELDVGIAADQRVVAWDGRRYAVGSVVPAAGLIAGWAWDMGAPA